MDSSQRLFQCLVNKSSFLALTVIFTFLNHSFPTSLEKKIKMVLKIVAVYTSIYHFEVILLSRGVARSFQRGGHRGYSPDYIWFIPLLSLVYQRAQSYYRGMKAG